MTRDQTADRDHPDGWDEHRRAELATALTTTPAERLRWLEDAIRFALRVGALPPGGRESARRSDDS